MAPSTFFLDDTCQAEVRLGPKPMVSLMRRRVGKPPTSIILTPEEWCQMTRRMHEIELELLMTFERTTPFLLNFAPSRALTITSYHGNDYVGVFKCENDEIKYYYGLNLTTSAWYELCSVKDEISKHLPANSATTSPNQGPAKRKNSTAEPSTSKRSKLTLDLQPTTLKRKSHEAESSSSKSLSQTDVKVYKWIKTSEDGCMVYDESRDTFYTEEGALKDAKLHPVDFSDTYGLKISTICVSFNETIFHPCLLQVARQTYTEIMRKLVGKKMTDKCMGCEEDQPGQLAHKYGCLAELDEIDILSHLSDVRKTVSRHTISRIIQSICNLLSIEYDQNVIDQCIQGNVVIEVDSTDCSNLIREVVNVKIY